MMRIGLMLVLGVGLAACDEGGQRERAGVPAPVAMPAEPEAVSRPAKVIPRPKDQAALDRLILAGFTPHGGHLHAPGVKSCPLSRGNEAVM